MKKKLPKHGYCKPTFLADNDQVTPSTLNLVDLRMKDVNLPKI